MCARSARHGRRTEPDSSSDRNTCRVRRRLYRWDVDREARRHGVEERRERICVRDRPGMVAERNPTPRQIGTHGVFDDGCIGGTWTAKLDGTELKNVESGYVCEIGQAWSPNGTRLVVRSEHMACSTTAVSVGRGPRSSTARS